MVIYTREYYLTIKNKIVSFAEKWMELEITKFILIYIHIYVQIIGGKSKSQNSVSSMLQCKKLTKY
jgi:hypothetical protein